MSPPRWLQSLSELLIRGREAPFLHTELEETYQRDLERHIPVRKARFRYVRNVLTSAWHLWRWKMRLGNPLRNTSWLDVKLGLRMLVKQPGLTLVAVFALSIGIPTSMIPVHLFDAMGAELPFDEADRIVGIRNRNIVENRTAIRALHDYFIWKEELTTFQAVGAARTDPYNIISDDGRAAPIRGSEISASSFDVVRVRPIMGRTLLPADEVKGAPEVVVLSHEVWQARLGGDPDAVGRTIRIGTTPHEVVGVMPEGFMFPMRDLLWLPLRDQPTDFERGMGPDVVTFGRLADGATMDEAQAELEIIGHRLATEYPDTHADLRPQVRGYTAMLAGIDPQDTTAMFLLQLIVIVLLAIVCGNVGTLIMARTATRSDEIAVRTALGAGRGRIVSQLFVESLVLAVLATGVGLLIGDRFADAFASRVFLEAPFWFDLGVKPKTVAVGLGLAVFCATIAGVVPALKATGSKVRNNLQRSGAGSGVRFGFGSTVLIVAEVALAISFLAVGGTLGTALIAGTSVDDGIARDEYMMALVRIPWTDHNAVENDLRVGAFADDVAFAHRDLTRRLEAETGVRRFAIGSRLPGMEHPRTRIEVEGEDQAEGMVGHRVHRAIVDIGFFDGFGKGIVEGRGFNTSDLLGTIQEDRTPVIVNTAFVEQVLGGRNAIGRRIRYLVPEDREPGPWYEVVGVVDHLGMNDLDPIRDEGFYHPGAPGEIHPLFVAVEVGVDPLSFAGRLREITAEVNADAMIQHPRVLSKAPNGDRDVNRYSAVIIFFVSAIAIILSGASLYALMSFTVSQRRREIGIRTALGATSGSIVGAIARRAAIQLFVGILIGVPIGSWLIGELLPPSALHVDKTVLLTSLAIFMTLVGVVACLQPTLRGLRIRPAEALKEQ